MCFTEERVANDEPVWVAVSQMLACFARFPGVFPRLWGFSAEFAIRKRAVLRPYKHPAHTHTPQRQTETEPSCCSCTALYIVLRGPCGCEAYTDQQLSQDCSSPFDRSCEHLWGYSIMRRQDDWQHGCLGCAKDTPEANTHQRAPRRKRFLG